MRHNFFVNIITSTAVFLSKKYGSRKLVESRLFFRSIQSRGVWKYHSIIESALMIISKSGGFFKLRDEVDKFESFLICSCNCCTLSTSDSCSVIYIVINKSGPWRQKKMSSKKTTPNLINSFVETSMLRSLPLCFEKRDAYLHILHSRVSNQRVRFV